MVQIAERSVDIVRENGPHPLLLQQGGRIRTLAKTSSRSLREYMREEPPLVTGGIAQSLPGCVGGGDDPVKRVLASQQLHRVADHISTALALCQTAATAREKESPKGLERRGMPQPS